MVLLQKDCDLGIFFSTGGFTPTQKYCARLARHVDLIDLDRFIAYVVILQQYAAKIVLLPLRLFISSRHDSRAGVASLLYA